MSGCCGSSYNNQIPISHLGHPDEIHGRTKRTPADYIFHVDPRDYVRRPKWTPPFLDPGNQTWNQLFSCMNCCRKMSWCGIETCIGSIVVSGMFTIHWMNTWSRRTHYVFPNFVLQRFLYDHDYFACVGRSSRKWLPTQKTAYSFPLTVAWRTVIEQRVR